MDCYFCDGQAVKISKITYHCDKCGAYFRIEEKDENIRIVLWN